MESTKEFLKNLLIDLPRGNQIFKRNILKEYLQILVLDFIYSHSKYSELVFYGGSCLAHCFGLPRLSEDLDFVDLTKKIDLEKAAKDLGGFFKKNTDLELKISVKKFRIYLKFPLLRELGLSGPDESDMLLLKIEIFKGFDFCKKYKTAVIPLFKFNKSILIKAFDLPTLMATKVRAILFRKWERTDKKGKTLIKVKGRDYFDLLWYLEKGIKPNINCLGKVKNEKELKENLLKIVGKIDARSIYLDLEPLIKDPDFVRNLSKNIKNILIRQIKTKM